MSNRSNRSNSATGNGETRRDLFTCHSEDTAPTSPNNDAAPLASLERKLQLVRDRTRGVVEGYATGCHIWGDGGIGKSFTVLGELNRLRADFVHFNSRLTGKGLFDNLVKYPSSVHVLEDCEALLRDKNALGVLRSALWSQARKRHPERLITWQSHGNDLSVVFTGGIILMCNTRLEDVPELRALKTRIASLHLSATNEELAALMRHLAQQGYRLGDQSISPCRCLEIAETVISRCLVSNRNLDVRLLVNAFRDFMQHRAGHSVTHWEDLLDTRLQEGTTAGLSRAERLENERQIALRISQMDVPTAERERLWREATGRAMDAYYRALARKVRCAKSANVQLDSRRLEAGSPWAVARPGLPQIRTCPIKASGSSGQSFACATVHRVDQHRRR